MITRYNNSGQSTVQYLEYIGPETEQPDWLILGIGLVSFSVISRLDNSTRVTKLNYILYLLSLRNK